MSTSLILDTSAVNRSLDVTIRWIASGFDVILTGTVAEEVISTPALEQREALLSRLDLLLSSGKSIWPAPQVLHLLASAHANDAAGFDWRMVDVRARVYEDAIRRRGFDATLCAEQRRHQLAAEEKFKKLWSGLAPALDGILAREPRRRPGSYQDAVAVAERDGGTLWGFGQGLYRISNIEATEAEIRSFVELCPPFRAACYGLVMAWYNWSLRGGDGLPTAGRNDLLMAAYLPYCRLFITDDWPQRNGLREIAQAARIDCDVLSVGELERSLLSCV